MAKKKRRNRGGGVKLPEQVATQEAEANAALAAAGIIQPEEGEEPTPPSDETVGVISTDTPVSTDEHTETEPVGATPEAVVEEPPAEEEGIVPETDETVEETPVEEVLAEEVPEGEDNALKTAQGLHQAAERRAAEAEQRALEAEQRASSAEHRASEFESLLRSGGGEATPTIEAEPSALDIEPETPPKSSLTEEDLAGYDESDIKVMRAIAQDVMRGENKRLADLEAQVSKLLALAPDVYAIKDSVRASNTNQYFDAMEREVPNWRAINEQEPFKVWAAQHDPLLGMTRGEAIQLAHNAMDVARVSAFFKAFIAESGGDGSSGSGITATPEKAAELAKQVSPGKGKTVVPATKVTDDAPTRAEVEEHYRRIAKGDKTYKQEERDAFQANLDKALKERKPLL